MIYVNEHSSPRYKSHAEFVLNNNDHIEKI